jgi:predicted metal-dependent hydrolase
MTLQTAIEPQIHYLAMKTARANIRGDRLVIKVPKQWPKRLQLRAIEQLTDWAQRHLARTDRQDWHEIEPGPTHTVQSLTELVHAMNAETYQVDVAKVRIGRAKYSRLAQANIRTKTITFSRFAIDGMPESALRYLITHELAHFLEANHSSRFWGHVARFIPEWPIQRKLAQDYQEMRVRQEDRERPAQSDAPAELPVIAPDQIGPLQLLLW